MRSWRRSIGSGRAGCRRGGRRKGGGEVVRGRGGWRRGFAERGRVRALVVEWEAVAAAGRACCLRPSASLLLQVMVVEPVLQARAGSGLRSSGPQLVVALGWIW